MTSPRDAPARDHIRDAHDVSLFVEAGAGTGKTSALVNRVVALVARGAVELRHVAAITFTEAAAAELRDRVRGALETVANGGDERYGDERARRRCSDGLHQLDDAAVDTTRRYLAALAGTAMSVSWPVPAPVATGPSQLRPSRLT